MFVAAREGHVAVVDALIAGQANVNATDKVVITMFCDECVICVELFTLTILAVATAFLNGRMVPHRCVLRRIAVTPSLWMR